MTSTPAPQRVPKAAKSKSAAGKTGKADGQPAHARRRRSRRAHAFKACARAQEKPFGQCIPSSLVRQLIRDHIEAGNPMRITEDGLQSLRVEMEWLYMDRCRRMAAFVRATRRSGTMPTLTSNLVELEMTL